MQYRPELRRESDRYRGRRRAPSPPRSRYAAVVTTAFVGAGVVAFGAGAGLKDAKVDIPDSDASAVAELGDLRDASANVASRSDRPMNSSANTSDPKVWLLPIHGYRFTSGFKMRWGKMHKGVDLAIAEGTPIQAVHAGRVIVSEYRGGYGYCTMIDHGNGLVTVYGHQSKLIAKEGQWVNAGDIIGNVGNTGHSYGPHVHLEIQVNGVAQNPITWFKAHGVDIQMEIEAAYGGVIS